MPITPDEMLALGLEAEQVAEFILAAIVKDEHGKKHLDKAKVGALLQKLGALASHVARDMID